MLKVSIVIIISVMTTFGQVLLHELNDLVLTEDGEEIIVGGKNSVASDDHIFSYGLIWRHRGGVWRPQRLDLLGTVRKMQWKNAQVGWVGEFGPVFFTQDGGASWKHVGDFRGKFFFLNPDTAWYFGYNDNKIIRRIGTVTQELFDFSSNYVRSIIFLSRERGWIHVVNNGKAELLETRDGGKSWTGFDHPATKELRDFQFMSGDEGYLATETTVFRTRDGGNSWEDLGLKKAKNLEKLFFLDSIHGWAIGENACRTSDGGVSWRCSSLTPETGSTFDGRLVFKNTREGWLLAEHRLYKTDNAGRTWRREILTYDGKRF